MQFDNSHMDLPSLIIWSCVFWTTVQHWPMNKIKIIINLSFQRFFKLLTWATCSYVAGKKSIQNTGKSILFLVK